MDDVDLRVCNCYDSPNPAYQESWSWLRRGCVALDTPKLGTARREQTGNWCLDSTPTNMPQQMGVRTLAVATTLTMATSSQVLWHIMPKNLGVSISWICQCRLIFKFRQYDNYDSWIWTRELGIRSLAWMVCSRFNPNGFRAWFCWTTSRFAKDKVLTVKTGLGFSERVGRLSPEECDIRLAKTRFREKWCSMCPTLHVHKHVNVDPFSICLFYRVWVRNLQQEVCDGGLVSSCWVHCIWNLRKSYIYTLGVDFFLFVGIRLSAAFCVSGESRPQWIQQTLRKFKRNIKL